MNGHQVLSAERPGTLPVRSRTPPPRWSSVNVRDRLAIAHGHLRPLLLTSCRKNEIIRLRRREVDSGLLRLEGCKADPRTVFLNRKARDIVERRLAETSGEFLFPSSKDPARPLSDDLSLWYEVRREAGIEDVRLHDLRHTYGIQAVMQGIPLPVVAQLLGHSKVTMTPRYAHTDNREIEASAERIGAWILECLGFSDSTADPN